MSDVLLFLYASAVGFVVAGLAAAIYRAVMAEPVRFKAEGRGILALCGSFLMGAFIGPAIIVRQSFASVQSGEVPSSWAAAGVMLAILWSGCIGIAVLAVAERLNLIT